MKWNLGRFMMCKLSATYKTKIICYREYNIHPDLSSQIGYEDYIDF